ncbi:Tumor protein 63 [Nymphon striatum]|nr:Tumor protein 63 [Nymphon striatum]
MRCVQHSLADNSTAENEIANHIIRCESNSAIYLKNPVTKEYEVLVPYIHPSDGESYPRYIFKFMCLSSCVGGTNKRPVKMVFILEQANNNRVLGIQWLNLKICKAPLRDMLKENPENTSSERDTTTNSEKESCVMQYFSIVPSYQNISYHHTKKFQLNADKNEFCNDNYLQKKSCQIQESLLQSLKTFKELLHDYL